MRYMFLVTQTKGGEPPQALVDAMEEARKQAVSDGGMISTGGLAPPEQGARATLVGGRLTVKDGPFAEAKEVLGGYWMIQVKSREEAIEWAKRAPMSDDEIIEVRRVQEMEDFSPEGQKVAKDFPEIKKKAAKARK